MRSTQCLLAALAATFCTATLAAPTTYTFAGVIDVNHSDKAGLSTFVGQFSFDRTTADADPNDPHDGYYPMGNGPYGMSVTFSNGVVFVVDPNPHYRLSVHVALPTPVGDPPDTGRFDVDGNVLNASGRFVSLNFRADFLTDALPWMPGGFDLSTFDQALFSYHGLPEPAPLPGQEVPPPFGAFGHLTALTCVAGCDANEPTAVVPEPATSLLMLAGLVAGVTSSRRRGLA